MMNTGHRHRNQNIVPWQSVSSVEIDEGLSYLGLFYCENSRHEVGHRFRNGCMDWNRNQTGGCFCVHDLLEKKISSDEEQKWEYAFVCEEISVWFRSAGELETTLTKNKKLGTKEFKESFARCTVLKKASTGIFTKMFDLSVPPGISMNDYNEGIGLSIRHNPVVSLSTLCLNSALNLWIFLTGSEFGGDDSKKAFRDWKNKKYGQILRWCAQVQEDVTNQKKKQELFYARIQDYLAATKEAKRIGYSRSMQHYRDMYGNLGTAQEQKRWRESAKKKWQRWNMKSIHVLYAGTNWNFNPTTQSLVQNTQIKVGRVSAATLETLLEIGKAMEKHKDYWRRVRQDKKLLYFPMPDSHNITSALNRTFRKTKRGAVGTKIKEPGFMERVKKVDEELEDLLLGLINTPEHRQVKQVAFQFTILMAKTHEVQHPHWDYTNESGGKDKFMVAFLPLTKTGQFLQIWEHEKGNVTTKQGKICFIPQGELVLVPGTLLHGGGFRAESASEVEHAHLRAHFYVYPGTHECMVSKHNNEYTDTTGAHMEEIYVNNNALSGSIEDGGDGSECLDWTFFEGKRPFDRMTGEEIKRKQSRSTKKKMITTAHS